MFTSTEKILKKVIAVLAVLFIFSVAYFGSYVPLATSMAFISTMQNAGNVHSVDGFKALFTPALDMARVSPIGQEELVRNTASSILGTIQSVGDPQVADALNKYISDYYNPIVARGYGMSFGQDLYIVGALNELTYVKTQDKSYLSLAEKYYGEAVAAGPNRPQGLYGLFDVYRMEGSVAQTEAVADKILMLWPTDEKTRSALDDYLSLRAATPPHPVAK